MHREALVLVPGNAAAGKVNGKQLAARAPLHGAARPASAEGIVVRIEARHSDPRGLHKSADDFRQLRRALHLCVAAKVMLILKRIWDVSTVPLGLMNGARGVVVAILYAPGPSVPGSASADVKRIDGSTIAGTGPPLARWERSPGGKPLARYLSSWSCTFRTTKAQRAFTTCPRLGCQPLARKCATKACSQWFALLCRCAWHGPSLSTSRKASHRRRGP